MVRVFYPVMVAGPGLAPGGVGLLAVSDPTGSITAVSTNSTIPR